MLPVRISLKGTFSFHFKLHCIEMTHAENARKYLRRRDLRSVEEEKTALIHLTPETYFEQYKVNSIAIITLL